MSPTVLITGATDGLGRALADRLAADGTTLVLHGRDHEKLRDTADSLRARGAQVHTAVADLADLDQVRRLATEVAERTDRLDVLVNNAGIGAGLPDGRTRQTSVDGYELRFAVNYLAGFALTLDLLPLLHNSTPARIVNVASIGQHPLDLGNLMLEHGYTGARAYGQSKLAQIMSGFELAEHLSGSGITVNSLHPATYMPTKMVLAEIGHSVDTLDTGVAATHRLVTDSTLATTTGRFHDRTHETKAHPQTYDPAVRHELWQRSFHLIGRTDLGL